MAQDRANQGQGRKPGVTNAEVARRVQLVYEMMLQGMRPQNIEDLIHANRAAKGTNKYRAELDWDVQFNQLCEYHRQATAMLKEEHVIERSALFRQSILRFEDLYRRALAVGDTRAARQHLKDRNALLDLNAFDHGGEGPTAPKGDESVVIELPGGRSLKLS